MKNFLIFTFLCLPFFVYSQDEEKSNDIIEESIDFLLDRDLETDLDYTTLFDQLQYFYDFPIKLNSTNFEELQKLHLLNSIQINNLLEHISKHGNLLAFEELQSVEGFDLQALERIRPFVTVSGSRLKKEFGAKRILQNSRSQLFVRLSRVLEGKKGYLRQKDEEKPDYLGSPLKLYTRFKFNYSNHISFGFTAEKDAGEEFFKGSNPNGFDFHSAHLFLEKLAVIEQLAIGDYQAQFGQGLTFSSGLSFGISPRVQSIKKNPRSLVPYTSAQENLFMRGIGTTLKLKSFDLTLFYSSHKVDANVLKNDSSSDLLEISSLPLHGFHRTTNEIENKNAVTNEYLGAHLNYGKKSFKLGITAVHNNVGANYRPQDRIYNKFGEIGETNTNLGLDYDYSHKNFSFFGEFSHSLNGGIAYTNGLLLIIDPRLSVAVQNRNYQKEYAPLQSAAVGESSSNSNEKGSYIGINAQIHKNLFVSAYVDRFAFPWLKFRVDAPSHGYRHLLQLEYVPNKKLKMYVRYRNRNKGKNASAASEGLNKVIQESLQTYRFNFVYEASEHIKLKSRVEYLNYSHGQELNEDGILIYQDVQYRNRDFPLSISVRFAIFDTDSYNSRIYAYENDVLYAFSIPAYYSKGSRFYLLAKYHIARGIDLWCRYSQSYYTNMKTIGTGNEEINANTKSEVKLQLRFKF